MSKIWLVGGAFVPTPRQSKKFIEKTPLHRSQKNKRFLMTSSEEMFLNILCSKNFFSNEKNRKMSLKNLTD